MPPLGQTLLATFVVTLAALFVLWLLSLVRRDASIVDPFWGCGFVIVAWTAFERSSHDSSRAILLVALTTIWGLRLSFFLLWRNWGHGEDRRYRAMRDHHGTRFWWVSLLAVFALQAVILWFVSFPIQAGISATSNRPLGWLDAIGLLLWSIGLFFETVGDWQLARFKCRPENQDQVMDRGLWRYTRHPNYFGDFCVWWGLYAIASAGGAWGTILSPLLMSVLLMKVSGVTLLESTITDRRPDYATYRSRTNAFFPGRPSSNTPGE